MDLNIKNELCVGSLRVYVEKNSIEPIHVNTAIGSVLVNVHFKLWNFHIWQKNSMVALHRLQKINCLHDRELDNVMIEV